MVKATELIEHSGGFERCVEGTEFYILGVLGLPTGLIIGKAC